MPVYMIVEVEIRDGDLYAEYVDRVREVVERRGGRYLARSEEIVSLAGDWRPQRVALIEFESLERLRACFGSPAYRQLTPLRERATTSRAIVVRGGTA